MTNRDVRKLRRADLLELLAQMARENERLKAELDQAKKELENRTVKMERAGTLAEAALALSGVFEAADAACAQYLENVRYTNEARMARRSAGTEFASEEAKARAYAPRNSSKNMSLPAVRPSAQAEGGVLRNRPRTGGMPR